MNTVRKVAVTGLGFVSSIGNCQKEVLASLRTGASGIDLHPQLVAANSPVKLAATPKGFEFPSNRPASWKWPAGMEIPRDELAMLAPHGIYARKALEEALGQAGLARETLQGSETGLLTATAGSPFMAFTHSQTMYPNSPLRCHPGSVAACLPGSLSFVLNASLGLHGASGGCVSACASSAQALGTAYDQIALGREKRMIVIGTEECDIYTIFPFVTLRALSTSENPQLHPCPFDQNRNGFVLGGGAAVIILEEVEFAKARGTPILAEFTGWGWTSDGFNPTAPEPQGRGLERAIYRALEQTKIGPDAIDYINAHATSTAAGDSAEAHALTRVFAESQPWISSTKGQTGHTLSMAGAFEAGICVLALQNGLVPQNTNLRTPDPSAQTLKLAIKPELAELNYSMSNSSGFGGVNVSLIFRRPDSPDQKKIPLSKVTPS